MTKTREKLKGCILVCVLSSSQSLAMDDWETVSAVEAGFSWDVGERLDDAFGNGELENLHSVVIARNGRLVVERYYKGFDENSGYPLGAITFTSDTLHDVQSIVKSIVSLLYGIALAEGKVPTLETPLVEAFPEYEDLTHDPDRRPITVEHALTMTMGLEWNEDDYPYGDLRNSWSRMEFSQDRFRFALTLPIVAEPGTTWIYSTGATTLLGEIVSRGVGKPLGDYAKEKLWYPLSITDVQWYQGLHLRMKPRDLAKIGQLVLNHGRWNGVQLVSSEWLASSFVERPTADEKFKYGYQWWLVHVQKSNDHWVYGKGIDQWIVGSGYGGQKLIVIPAHQLVIVINAGNYGLHNSKRNSKLVSTIVLENVLPAMAN